jgi:CRISPR-associated protein Csb2
MLALEIEFLTGRYIATAYNSRQEAEWPPHPARLFSALVATHFASEEPDSAERLALEWLEALGPPSIRASEASQRELTTVFVPVNDVAMTKVDDEAAELEAAQVAVEAARSSAEVKAYKSAAGKLEKAKSRFATAVAKGTRVPKRVTKEDLRSAAMVLPEGRLRQPRTIPSVTPLEARVTFVWPSADPTEAQRAALGRLLDRLVRLGHSSSLLAARFVDENVIPNWRPSPGGETKLRTVREGQLRALVHGFSLHQELEPRVLPAQFESYTQLVPEPVAIAAHSSFAESWLVLRRVGGPSIPMVACAGVASTLRRALMAHAQPAPEILSGHSADGAASDRDHLAIVPLPFVGHPHASGAILGVALILPRETPEEQRRAVYSAVAAWEKTQREEDEDAPRLPLFLGAAGVLELQRLEWGAVQSTLRASTWCQPAKVWSSVTPMALDRNPGDLRSTSPDKQKKAIAEAVESVERACARIGLPSPEHVEILPAAPWSGAAKSRRYPPFPEGRDRTRRVLTHVRLAFSGDVRGPILLGAGRYLGLGLFRPESNHG